MTVTAEMVRKLRDMTGAGMMDCKSALLEAGGDLEIAVDRLKARGIVNAERKAGREATDGLIAVAVDATGGAIVELNSETDFVARNETFQALAGTLAALPLRFEGDIDSIKALAYPGSQHSVADELSAATARIGERIHLNRIARLFVEKGVVASYVHNTVAPGMGRLGVLVALESRGDAAALQAVGKQLAMHVANTRPLAVSAADVSSEVVERERRIFREQAAASGKPAEIVEKMVEGRVRKFYEEVALLSQTFVVDGRTRIAEVLRAAEKDVGAPILVTGFVRYAIGEA